MDKLEKFINDQIKNLLGKTNAATITYLRVSELSKVKRILQHTPERIQKTLREKYSIHMFTKVFYDSLLNKTTYTCDAVHIPDGRVFRSPKMDSYELALEYALDRGLELVKEMNKISNLK